MPSDRVTEAADELYAADPADFMQRRKTLADAARADGDKEAAKRITALRKPTRVAWILNHLSRADPGTPGRLETLAADLRAAAQAKDGRRLRELSADRGELIDALTSQALEAADVTDPPAGLREEVAATLTSAFADPEIGQQFATGTLTRAAQWAGFGLAPVTDTPDSDADAAPEEDATPDREPAPVAPATRDREAPTAHRQGTTTARPARRTAPAREPRPTAPPPKAPQAPRRAEVAEDAAARQRKAFDDAERSLLAAAQAAAAALTAEDDLEATVRDLEERVTKARADLADARLRARRAESAERKARQTLDRLPRPLRTRARAPDSAFGHVSSRSWWLIRWLSGEAGSGPGEVTVLCRPAGPAGGPVTVPGAGTGKRPLTPGWQRGYFGVSWAGGATGPSSVAFRVRIPAGHPDISGNIRAGTRLAAAAGRPGRRRRRDDGSHVSYVTASDPW